MYIFRPSGRSHYQRRCLTKRGKKRGCSLSAPAILQTPEKKRRMKWTDEQMVAAIKAVEKNGSGINQAAIAYNVPKTTP